MSNYTIVNGELYHHGVKGMKWGVRKAKDNYKNAKRAYRDAEKNRRKSFDPDATTRNLKKSTDAYAKMIEAKAKYKASKARNSEKAEMKSYVKSMKKTGLPDSIADFSSNGKSSAIYNRLKVEKGKDYADRVATKVNNQVVADIVSSTVVAVGGAAVAAMLSSR